MKLILDFDDVLFNAKDLKEVMFSLLLEEGVLNGNELYDRERRSGRVFMLKDFLKFACTTSGEGGSVLVEVNVDSIYEKIMSTCPDLVNQDMIKLLQLVGKENCYIISNGDQEYQKDKIIRAGLDTMVTAVIVVPGTKSKEIEKVCSEFPNDEVLFVDDKQSYFDDIDYERCKNLKTILYKGKESMSEIENEIHKIQVPENQKSMSGGPVMR